MNEQENKVYYDYEILPIIQGLDNVYQSKPWYSKWIYKPWHDALATLAIQLCGDLMLKNEEQKQAVSFIEDFLD